MLAGSMFENINGKTGKSKNTYVFRNNGKWFANINGTVSNGYDGINIDYHYNRITYYGNGKYAYWFYDNRTIVMLVYN
jgi:hypothetical protein